MKEIIVNNAKDKKIISVVEDSRLIEKYEECEEIDRIEGNIYLGIITDVLPGMQAAFVDIGDEKNAFLHIKDILPKASNETGNKNEDLSKYNIKDYVKVGMPVIVEVKKDKTDKKGAKVSANLNLAGKFVVLIPNSEFITISQKIENSIEVENLVKNIQEMNIKNYGVILRTSAINATKEQLEEDVKNVIELHKNIQQKAQETINKSNTNPQLLYSKGGIINRLLLDLGNQDLTKIIVNNSSDFQEIKQLIKDSNLNTECELIERENILDIYNLENQIEKISNRKVWLKCGGFITIDKTEALTAIDVNTGKFTGKESIEKTVLKVNLEATTEIAKQLRARDIGGIVVIDYIDMDNKQDEEEVQNLLIENLKKDRAKTQVVGFTKLHLLEMTRKRIY